MAQRNLDQRNFRTKGTLDKRNLDKRNHEKRNHGQKKHQVSAFFKSDRRVYTNTYRGRKIVSSLNGNDHFQRQIRIMEHLITFDLCRVEQRPRGLIIVEINVIKNLLMYGMKWIQITNINSVSLQCI